MKVFAAIHLVVALGFVTSLRAEPSKEDLQEAQRRFAVAEDYFQNGKYALAAEAYEDAYRAAPLPAFLFNAAQAYRLDKKPDLALAAYKKFLELAPDHVLAKDAQKWAKQIEELIPTPEVVPDTPLPQPQTPPRPDPAVVVKGAPEGHGRGLRIAGYVLGGTSVALFALSTKFALDARAHDKAITSYDDPAWTDATLARQRKGENAERNMIITATAASAALVAGGVLYWIGWRRGDSAVEVQPMVTADSASVTVGVTF